MDTRHCNSHGGTILYTAAEISDGIDRVARELHSRLENKENTDFITVLNGGAYFAKKLLPRLWAANSGEYGRVQSIKVSTYGDGQESSNALKIEKDIEFPILREDVVLLDDVADTGLTLSELTKLSIARGAQRVLTTVLVDKPAFRVHRDGHPIMKPHFWAVYYSDRHWLYGCGMDIDSDPTSRELNDLWMVPPKK